MVDEEKKKLVAADGALLQKFTDLACDEAAEMRWRETQFEEADNIDVGPVTGNDTQSELFQSGVNPF